MGLGRRRRRPNRGERRKAERERGAGHVAVGEREKIEVR